MIDISYFFLKDNKIVNLLGSGCFDVYLINKSLFEYYLDTRDLNFILYTYIFILTFNLYDNPVVPAPVNPALPLSDVLFTYANSFIFIQKWLINETRNSTIDNINTSFDYIINRLHYWKQQDSNNTYCTLQGTAYCSGMNCSLTDTHHCVLTHYLTAWDNLENDILQEKQALINNINIYFDWLVDNTEELFKIKLFWTFVLTTFFAKFPAIALKEREEAQNKKGLSKMNQALLIIVANKNRKKDIIKEKIKRKLKITNNAINIIMSRLKSYGYIYYTRDSDIELKELAYKKVNYLIDKYKISLYEFK